MTRKNKLIEDIESGREGFKAKLFLAFQLRDANKVDKEIDNLFDYFASRTCENCKYASLYDDREDGVFCNHTNIWAKQDIDFGCNKFEEN